MSCRCDRIYTAIITLRNKQSDSSFDCLKWVPVCEYRPQANVKVQYWQREFKTRSQTKQQQQKNLPFFLAFFFYFIVYNV